MKKTLLMFVLVFMVVLAGLSAQSQVSFPITSLQSDVSYGLFPNVIDASFNLVSFGDMDNFRTLDSNYFFSGLSNFWDLTATSGLVTTKPVEAGFYHKSPMPWSVLGATYATSSPSNLSNGISTITTTTKTTGTAPNFTNHTWVTQTVDEQYVWLSADQYDIGAQFLINIGKISTGLALKYYLVQNFGGSGAATWAGNNRTETETNYYDTAAATDAPDPQVDYTVTRTWNAPDTYTEIIGSVPFTIGFDSIELSTNTSVDFISYDGTGFSSFGPGTGPTTETYSDPQGPGPTGGTYTNTEADEDSYKYKTIFVNNNSTLVLPSIFKENKNNRLEVGLEGGVGFFMPDIENDRYITQVYNYAGGGATPTLSTRSVHTKTITWKGIPYYDVKLSAKHYFYFDFGMAVFGFSPVVETAIKNNPNFSTYSPFYMTDSVETVRTDGNNDGDFADAADSVTTTTITYSNNEDGIPLEVSISAKAPTSLKFRQEKWPFGVTLGADIGVVYTVDFNTDVTDVSTTVVRQEDGTGVLISETTTTAGSSYKVTRVSHDWNFNNEFKLGLNFFLPGNITIDVILNSNNLLEFDKLTAQASIPL